MKENPKKSQHGNTTLDIQEILTLSTCHITKETAELLSDDDYNITQYDITVYKKDNIGWFVYIISDCNSSKIPTDLKLCIALAKTKNCSIICLDRDGNQLDCLPKHNW